MTSLDASPLSQPFVQLGERFLVTRRDNGRWNIHLCPLGERRYLASLTPRGEAAASVRIEEIDPVSLATLRASVELSTGGHRWPGSLQTHPNGDLYLLAGCFLHRLDPELDVIASLELPGERPHHSLLIMDDGGLFLKDVRLAGSGPGRLILVDADEMTVLTESTMPEPSFGGAAAAGNDLYIPGDQSIFRFRYRRGGVLRDTTWTGRYRTANDDYGVASNVTLGHGQVWVCDNADTPEMRHELEATPTGPTAPTKPSLEAFSTAHRLHRFSCRDASDNATITPFAVFDSWVHAAPTVVPDHQIVITIDEHNAGMSAYRMGDDGGLTQLWRNELRPRWQPAVSPDGSQILVDDLQLFADDNVVVLDAFSGRLLGRAPSGSTQTGRGEPVFGRGRSVVYLAGSAIARVEVVSGPGWAPPKASDVALLPPPPRSP
jgi:hypothetical protein